MHNIKKYISVIFLGILLTACLHDENLNIPSIGLDDNAKLLVNVESRSGFLNSFSAPGVVSPEEILLNKEKYLILDIRNSESFSNGRIPGALSVRHQDLPSIVGQNYSAYEKIVLVSYSGQAACFYATLLRYLRYENVFALQFGMASWNIDFAQPWFDVIKSQVKYDLVHEDNLESKGEYTHLPHNDIINNDLEGTAEHKILDLFNEYYKDHFDKNLKNNLVTDVLNFDESTKIICYDQYAVYYSKGMGIGHPAGSSHYRDKIVFDLRTNRYLQTIPSDKKIIAYSADGQLSACVVAYLKVLGYDVKGLNFGACRFAYNGIAQLPDDIYFHFSANKIKNYPYEKD